LGAGPPIFVSLTWQVLYSETESLKFSHEPPVFMLEDPKFDLAFHRRTLHFRI